MEGVILLFLYSTVSQTFAGPRYLRGAGETALSKMKFPFVGSLLVMQTELETADMCAKRR